MGKIVRNYPRLPVLWIKYGKDSICIKPKEISSSTPFSKNIHQPAILCLKIDNATTGILTINNKYYIKTNKKPQMRERMH